eukprot:TRINITY_DN2921_c0_g1_i2.p1 TRINITY_DN2921_c0_g1~~TRINITY_DN2921_c0_g1_i2.p1  ORF type:complete len:264 (-),score=59.00 TRINITY_DN2921_c0_g1_i2:36-827(-)
MDQDHEIFEAAGNNDVKRLREFLDCGVDINVTDFDKGWTPLHVAASRGAKQAMELLVMRGCDMNCQDNRGSTPLHSLVYKRFDVLAMWLVRQGANLHLPDARGFSPFDNALDWQQKELENAANGKDESEGAAASAAVASANAPVAAAPARAAPDEVIKVYFRNGSYKTVRVSRDDTSHDLIEKAREKLGLNKSGDEKHLETVEVIKGQERRLGDAANLFVCKSKWPVVFGESGGDTDRHCHFMIVPKPGAPPDVTSKYEQAIA